MFFDEPTYLIQFGFNGQTVVKRALKNGHTDGVILSPTDYPYDKATKLASKVSDHGKTVLCDPQFYIPRTDKTAASTYPYFEKSGGKEFQTVVISEPKSRQHLCEQIFEVQESLGVDVYLTPARYLDTFSNRKLKNWEELTKSFIDLVREKDVEKPVFASLPVSGESITDDQSRNLLLDRVTSLSPDGFYISVQFDRYKSHPLQGVNEVRAYLDLIKNIRYNHFDIVVGHTHQISHLIFGLGVNAYASGHFQNTKAFDVDRWIPEDEGFGQGGVYYYYSDMILNELRTEQGLQNLYAHPSYNENKIRMEDSPYEGELFSSSPEDATWKMSEAEWDHWIWACYQISRQYRNKDLKERSKHVEYTIKAADRAYDEIKKVVDPQDNVVDDIYDDWLTAYRTVKSPAYLREVEWMLS